MTIEDNTVVSLDYTLKNNDGKVLDQSTQNEPLNILYGKGQIIPGLEKALGGKNKGDSFSVSVEPTEAYGDYSEELMIQVGKDQFEGMDNITEGMQVQAQSQDGQVQILTVKAIEGDTVTLDANHPLAGETLHFDISILDVREATETEKAHGHSHDGLEDHEEQDQ